MNEWTLLNVDNVESSLTSQGLMLRSLHLWYALMWLRDAVDSYALVLIWQMWLCDTVLVKKLFCKITFFNEL